MILYGNREARDILEVEKFDELVTAHRAVGGQLESATNAPNASLQHVAKLAILENKLKTDLSTSFGDDGHRNFEKRSYSGDEAQLVLNALSRLAGTDKKPLRDEDDQSWLAASAGNIIDTVHIEFDTGEIHQATAQAEEPQSSNVKR